MQMPKRLAGSECSFPALNEAIQLAGRGSAEATSLQQDEDSLLRSKWSIQAVPGLASKKQDLALLRRWLSVSPASPIDAALCQIVPGLMHSPVADNRSLCPRQYTYVLSEGPSPAAGSFQRLWPEQQGASMAHTNILMRRWS